MGERNATFNKTGVVFRLKLLRTTVQAVNGSLNIVTTHQGTCVNAVVHLMCRAIGSHCWELDRSSDHSMDCSHESTRFGAVPRPCHSLSRAWHPFCCPPITDDTHARGTMTRLPASPVHSPFKWLQRHHSSGLLNHPGDHQPSKTLWVDGLKRKLTLRTTRLHNFSP